MSDEVVKVEEESPPMPSMTEDAFNQIVQAGDFSRLGQTERSIFLAKFAERLGLNWLTKPLDLIVLNGKLTIYANRTATDQLAQKHKLSTEILSEERDDERQVYTVKVRVTDPNNRSDVNIGSVGIAELQGEAYSNATMKAYTKAKRRAILAFTGLGFLDELEIQSIQGSSEEAMARRGVSTTAVFPAAADKADDDAAASVVQVAAPENPAPQIEATPTPGKPLPPSQPPTEVK
jgi:hypothetical protein